MKHLHDTIREGLVIAEKLHRGQWPLTLIKEVGLGRDDRLRSLRPVSRRLS